MRKDSFDGCNKRRILIVDDDQVSSAVLCHILGEEYDTVTAANGQEALEILGESNHSGFSLILLDLLMPVMDGYEFLEKVMKDKKLSSIPIIVTTVRDCEEDEILCLEKGAVDFLSKPFQPTIVKKRVDRIIQFQETSAVLNAVERDRLTGLYSRESFYLEVERILEKEPDESFDMVVADVENFKLINDRIGVEKGDLILRYMADRYLQGVGNQGICTRMHGDVFAIFIRHGDGSWKKDVLWQLDEKVLGLKLHNVAIKYGIYENVRPNIAPFGMCDRAVIALNQIKNRYGKNVAYYKDSLRTDLIREQQILDSMESALEEHQFQVYYQPKYDIHTDSIAGAEALVRWIHPEYGFMSPGEFIPLFERKGLITKLDYYVWKEACETLRKWKEERRKAIPVSVNISRMDFSVPDLAEWIISLVDRYEIDRKLLHLEITESVYAEDPKYIIKTIEKLRANGFIIEMDDFGSGYSSLNALSELPVDILKLDMKFIQSGTENKKNILGFVISLSKWLNLPMIAEGVETREQLDKLKNFGCDYVQGYYYAKPMPRKDFEAYLEKDATSVHAVAKEPLENLQIFPKKAEGQAATLLIAEDNELNRDILSRMLSPYFHLAMTVNGKEALDYLEENPGKVSLILLDMVMPVMDGFQFMNLRNKDEELSKIPVIITSENEEDSELMALKMGAERFVGKPYKKELLLLSIKKALESHR